MKHSTTKISARYTIEVAKRPYSKMKQEEGHRPIILLIFLRLLDLEVWAEEGVERKNQGLQT